MAYRSPPLQRWSAQSSRATGGIMSSGNYAITPLPVVVFADFICPYSYIALDQMDELLRDYNIELLWRPHWLHPEVPREGAPIPDEAKERRAQTRAWLN